MEPLEKYSLRCLDFIRMELLTNKKINEMMKEVVLIIFDIEDIEICSQCCEGLHMTNTASSLVKLNFLSMGRAARTTAVALTLNDQKSEIKLDRVKISHRCKTQKKLAKKLLRCSSNFV
jgi:hypothetical protein